MITGESEGIGFATAKAFAVEGAGLHLAARTESDLEMARDEIQREFNVSVVVYPADFSEGGVVRRLERDCAGVFILMNSAGPIRGGTLEDVNVALWRRG